MRSFSTLSTLPTKITRETVAFSRAITVCAALAVVWAFWASGPGWTTPALIAMALGGSALAVIDSATHRLPNVIMYPTTVIVAILLLVGSHVAKTPESVVQGLGGAMVLGGTYLVLHLINPAGLGFGDVKLAVLLGMVCASYGWSVLWGAALLPVLAGGAVSLVLLATGKAHRGTSIAFEPYMLLGAASTVTVARIVN